MNELNKQLIRSFWKARSQKATIRWTSDDLLAFELEYLRDQINIYKEGIRILDLGCGHGELSTRLARSGDYLLGVDYVEDYSNSFEEKNNHFFTSSDVVDFAPVDKYDLVLLMGVVQFLDIEEELRVYNGISKMLTPRGLAVIKNQVGNKSEVLVNGYSENLKEDYSSRYPYFFQQLNSVSVHLHLNETIEYPSKFNNFSDTRHVAFICRKTL